MAMNTAVTLDARTETEKADTWGFVVSTDSFMSGWGHAPGRSLYAVAVADHHEAEVVLRNAKGRSEMKRSRIQGNLPRLWPGDHLKIVGRSEASRWFEPGAWV
jgi:hypothetical protein